MNLNEKQKTGGSGDKEDDFANIEMNASIDPL